MAEIEFVDLLREAVENMHGGTATLVQSVPVRETFGAQTAWQGEVYIFDLAGHPTATRAYAWSSPIEGSTKPRFFAVLHIERTYLPVDAAPICPRGLPLVEAIERERFPMSPKVRRFRAILAKLAPPALRSEPMPPPKPPGERSMVLAQKRR